MLESSNPCGDWRGLLAKAVQESSDSMITIEDFVAILRSSQHDGRGDSPMPGDVVCTCPKPLLSPLEICRGCRCASFNVRDDFLDDVEAEFVKLRVERWDMSKLPWRMKPIIEGRSDAKDVAPVV